MSLKKTPDFIQNIFGKEMSSGPHDSYRFKTFVLDVEDRQLLNNGVPVALTPKVFDVLVMLVKRAGHLVEKEELMQTVWADSFVEDANVSRAVHTLRRALGEDQNGNKFIATVAKKGYRFVADVSLDARRISEPDAGVPDVAADAWPAEIETAPNAPDSDGSSAALSKPHMQRRYVLVGLALLLFLSLGSYFAYNWAAAQRAGIGSPVSIVILPFRPLDVANRDEVYDLFFADSLITQLSHGPKNLQVRQFSSMRNYLDVKQDALAIGREQKANFVFESNYIVSDGRIRGTWKLLNVADGSVEATSSYSLDGSDRYAAAESIVLKIAPELLAKLSFAPVKPVLNRGTSSEAAWRHWVQGTNLTNRRELRFAEQGVAEFEQAVSIDPDYADGWVGLAYAHETAFINGGERAKHCPPAREAVERAIAIAPDLGDAHAIRAINTQSCVGDKAETERSFQRALELSPNSPFVRRFYGIYLTNIGRGDESVAELEKAIELEPNLPWTERLLGRALFYARHYDKAIEQVKKARELDPNDISEQTGYLFMSYQQKGDFSNALEWFLVFESLKGAGEAEIASFRQIYTRSGWPGVLQKRLEIAEEKERGGAKNYGEIASLAAQVGDKEKAFAYLEKAMPIGQLFRAGLRIDPNLDPLRSDPRFDALIAQTWPG